MKIAIISDTHDNTPAIVWIIEQMNKQSIKTAFHAGDIINPGVVGRFARKYEGHLHLVFGNNDGEQALIAERSVSYKNITCHKNEMNLELEGKKLFMNHYSTIGELAAKSGEYDICIGGHDHRYRVTEHGKSLFINPGNTVTKDKWLPQELEKESSFVVFDLEKMEHERIMLPEEFQF